MQSHNRCRSHKFFRILLILSCLTGAVLAQTFQYSRGWTNGRKRAGPLLVPSAASGLLQDADESNPCSQLQRIKFLLGARNPQQIFFPCDTWREVSESASDNTSERFKRRAARDAATLNASDEMNHEN
ncbi:hypothetical protein C0J52_20332 [Blattella germanica]|nr:hypothetical protein C0J52_20332 [Blattella germanica]